MKKLFLILMILIVTVSACNLPISPVASSPTQPDATLKPMPTPTLITKEPDLAHRPLYWFGPLPPLPVVEGRPFTGSDDFMQLFELDAPWKTAAEKIQVFKLYGEWVGNHPGDAQLQKVIGDSIAADWLSQSRRDLLTLRIVGLALKDFPQSIVLYKMQELSSQREGHYISSRWMSPITTVTFTMDPTPVTGPLKKLPGKWMNS